MINVARNHLLNVTRVVYCKSASFSRLVEVGHLEEPRQSGTYPSGQLFLHKLYGYRGVVLFPWTARVYDRNTLHDLSTESCTFYSALMDERDSPLVRAGVEAVTVLGDLNTSRSQYEVPGLDYVDHRDILPYKDTAWVDRPLQHSSLANFLTLQPDKNPPFKAKPTLKVWEKKTRHWMDRTEVYRETTETVRVTVIPFYLGSRVSQKSVVPNTPNSHVWRYHVSLENLGRLAIQVKDSMWCVFTVCGGMVSERSAWLAGQEPLLSRQHPAFQYCGHASLPATRGYMFGYFRLALEDGHRFFCRSPILELKTCPPANECPDDDYFQ